MVMGRDKSLRSIASTLNRKGSDEQCGAKCVAITCSLHGSVVFPCGTCG